MASKNDDQDRKIWDEGYTSGHADGRQTARKDVLDVLGQMYSDNETKVGRDVTLGIVREFVAKMKEKWNQ